ncbi:protein PHLOEM PROTEIN 2-LIKE A5-like [Arabidopsis lyrata subsp. lyrata]|uniref:protein PHLOEM PROTEIN 2-LIKE A5-like n=1 Tax=Arabidopsis lyrata subsp. lyrata TaxID=81972 RepID=UPI000A29CF3A|nr:protein PHLOEM PROTEIN 2-LIKE A5-like [Arabidopsis lyrata subsp. lyrata]XP_020873692.1 protein PHLOEM PROTEIN 2-LIKE A5-like [Arabidopsis lyrata subsp. lyrata]|eukprot:XP_020873691.1 protein PHLOEM PROTEIN 2-LIKE A5-like [Arabidopsis lyrata subsp. lyrata]
MNVFIDEDEIRGRPISILFQRIRESSIALAIFSNKYPESCWCLDELVEIKKQMDTGSLVPFPIFYKVEPDSVKTQRGYFLNTLLKTEDYVRQKVDRSSSKSILETEARIWGWRQALVSVCERMGSPRHHKSDKDFVSEIAVEVKKILDDSSPRNYLTIIERPPMHPQEEVTSLLQALNLNISDLEDLITKPSEHFNDVVVSLGTDDLVFLDLISLQNHILASRLSRPGQAGKILLVLLGSLEY